jgi:hypothetical protein
MCCVFASQYVIPGLQTNISTLKATKSANANEELLLDNAVVLLPKSDYPSRTDHARLAVAELGPNSVLCWATQDVTGPNPYQALMVAAVHGPQDADWVLTKTGWESEGSNIEAFMQLPKVSMRGSKQQKLPDGKTADTLTLPTKAPNSWVFGPSCYQDAPVGLSQHPLLVCIGS